MGGEDGQIHFTGFKKYIGTMHMFEFFVILELKLICIYYLFYNTMYFMILKLL